MDWATVSVILAVALGAVAMLAGYGLGWYQASRHVNAKLDALLIAQGFEPHDLMPGGSLADKATWLHRAGLGTQGSPNPPRPRRGAQRGRQAT
jgi:hypothetical protein